MIDFHTHILPNMDDGSDSVETSLELLNILEGEGVELVCLTSHFYAKNESIVDFVQRRKEAFDKLNYSGKMILKLGAEIRYYRGISESENINELCLEGTNILLIELPFLDDITSSIVNEIIKLKNKGYKVVLAHIERYGLDKKILDEFKDNGILFQMNTEFVDSHGASKYAINMIKNGYITFLGTDCHNLSDRSPKMLKALNYLGKKLDSDVFASFIEKPYNILESYYGNFN